ncbi:MAG: YbhN family protein [Acidimicrobiales bacterium]
MVKLLVVALVVHLFVIPQLGGARKALSLLRSVNPLLVLAALCLVIAALVAYGRLTQVLLPDSHRPSLGVCTAVVVASNGINHVVPGGAATTAAVNARLLDRLGVPGPDIAFVLATQGLGSAVVLNVILWLALVISIPTRGFDPLYGTAAAAAALLLVLVVLLVVGLRHGTDVVVRLVHKLVGWLPRVDPDRAETAVRRFAEHLAVLARDRHRLRMAAVWATANWLLDASALWVMLVAFGHRPGFDGLMVAYGLANVMAVVPITPGGLGIVEAVLIPTLVGFGTPYSVAAVGVIAYRLINFWLPIPVGGLCYVAVQRRARSASGSFSWRGDLNELATGPNPGPSGSEPG